MLFCLVFCLVHSLFQRVFSQVALAALDGYFHFCPQKTTQVGPICLKPKGYFKELSLYVC